MAEGKKAGVSPKFVWDEGFGRAFYFTNLSLKCFASIRAVPSLFGPSGSISLPPEVPFKNHFSLIPAVAVIQIRVGIHHPCLG